MPTKTATGTVAIDVEDFNDHCPQLTIKEQQLCTTNQSFIVNAYDEDAHPNGAPFHFSIIEGRTEGKWRAEPINGEKKDFHFYFPRKVCETIRFPLHAPNWVTACTVFRITNYPFSAINRSRKLVVLTAPFNLLCFAAICSHQFYKLHLQISRN